MFPLHRKFNRFRNMKPTCQIRNVKPTCQMSFFVFYQLIYYVCQIIHVFGCSDPGYYFRFIGLLVQYIIIVDIFHNGLRTCVLFSSRINMVLRLKIIHIDASIISLISSINCMLAYKTVLQANRALTAFMDLVQQATIAVV